MSYEGYSQLLCKRGHLIEIDCNDDTPAKCNICGQPYVWINSVDLTSGSFFYDERLGVCTKERIDGYIELEVKKRDIEKCEHCGSNTYLEVTYKIPKGKGHKI